MPTFGMRFRSGNHVGETHTNTHTLTYEKHCEVLLAMFLIGAGAIDGSAEGLVHMHSLHGLLDHTPSLVYPPHGLLDEPVRLVLNDQLLSRVLFVRE